MTGFDHETKGIFGENGIRNGTTRGIARSWLKYNCVALPWKNGAPRSPEVIRRNRDVFPSNLMSSHRSGVKAECRQSPAFFAQTNRARNVTDN